MDMYVSMYIYICKETKHTFPPLPCNFPLGFHVYHQSGTLPLLSNSLDDGSDMDMRGP